MSTARLVRLPARRVPGDCCTWRDGLFRDVAPLAFNHALDLTALHLRLQRQDAGHAVVVALWPKEGVPLGGDSGRLGFHVLEHLGAAEAAGSEQQGAQGGRDERQKRLALTSRNPSQSACSAGSARLFSKNVCEGGRQKERHVRGAELSEAPPNCLSEARQCFAASLGGSCPPSLALSCARGGALLRWGSLPTSTQAT